jgi:3-methyladenine DNA glycosylase AlkD
MSISEITDKLQLMGKEMHLEKMQRFGIPTDRAYGISMPDLRRFAKEIGKNHGLALQLWDTGKHEARILASLVDKHQEVTPEQMEDWVAGFNAWDVCDQVCSNLFARTPYALEKALVWSHHEEEFIKRAGFSMMAYIAVHHKKANDDIFIPFFERIEAEAYDDRNFVKKAVNWALRQIGKRNKVLYPQAMAIARQISQQPYRSAKWIAKDALRELENEKIKVRLGLM